MVIKKFILLASLLLILFYLVSCGASDTAVEGQGFSGKYGLKFTLSESDKEETQVFQNSNLFYQVEIENHGPVAAELKFKTSSNLAKDYVQFQEAQNKNIPQSTIPGEPERVFVEFYGNVISAEGLPKDTRFQTVVEACYNYETNYNKLFCIRGDPEIPEKDPVCQSNTILVSSEGQAAPISVESIEYRASPSGNDVIHFFKIHLSQFDYGGDTEIFRSSFDSCTDYKIEDYYANRWIVDLLEARLGKNDLDCAVPKDGIILSTGRRSIDCRVTLPKSSDNLLSPLQFKFKYGVNTKIEPKKYKLEGTPIEPGRGLY